MSIITDLTRMWLTRSAKPFLFQNEYDQQLPFSQCEGLGLYVHIPFCRELCGFCPYCKVQYDRAVCDRYLDRLIQEIHLVGGQLPGRKRVTSLYFGGGTPALAAGRLKEVMEAIEAHFIITEGVGVELHPEDVVPSVLRILRDAGVTRISIGVQSFQRKFQGLLGRRPVDLPALRRRCPRSTLKRCPWILFLPCPDRTWRIWRWTWRLHSRPVPIMWRSIPSLISPSRPARCRLWGRGEKRALLDGITRWCLDRGYIRSSLWTFAKEQDAVYSSMTRDHFLGFGCSAATLLRDQFKINTFSVEEYCRRIDEGKLPTSLTLRFSLRQRMVYYLFWTAYSTEVDAGAFEQFFGVPLKKDVRYGAEAGTMDGAGHPAG